MPGGLDENMKYIELCHTVENGMITYPGDPAVVIDEYMSREEMREKCGKAAALLDRIQMINTSGTYLDAPFHRFEDGYQICDIPLEKLVDIPAEVVKLPEKRRCFEREDVECAGVPGGAVLLYTGHSKFFGTNKYGDNAPYLTVEGAKCLIERGIVFVGIDTPLIDRMNSGDCPVHDIILGSGGIVCENMTNLEEILEYESIYLTAVPPKVKMSSCTARVFVKIKEA